MPGAFVVGIAGGSGSGKSTLVGRLLAGRLGAHLAELPHDAYYRDGIDMPAEVRRARNWDHPDSLDNDLYADHIDRLAAGRAAERPEYDFASHSRKSTTVRVEPRPVLLLDGILLFAVPKIRERIHLRVFVETPADLRAIRRMRRDIVERGRTAESVAQQYEATVRPMDRLFVEPSRAFAHVLVPWTDDNPAAVALLEARLAAAFGPA